MNARTQCCTRGMCDLFLNTSLLDERTEVVTSGGGRSVAVELVGAEEVGSHCMHAAPLQFVRHIEFLATHRVTTLITLNLVYFYFEIFEL